MTRFRTVPSRSLSLWQSAVTDTVRSSMEDQLLKSGQEQPEQQADLLAAAPLAAADNPAQLLASLHEHILREQVEDNPGPLLRASGSALDASAEAGPGSDAAEASRLMYEAAIAKAEGNEEEALRLMQEARKYSTGDYAGWATCITTFIEYYTKYRNPYYRDWKELGQPIGTYGVVPYVLPDDAKVGLIGDWATGMPDAKELVKHMVNLGVDAIIHLGDIYYSGTPDECNRNFNAIFDEVFAETGKPRIPVFTIPGNHDYYAFGYGFYSGVIDKVNANHPDWKQEASYFSLRTQDGAWQFLGMDTGRHDYNPKNDMDPTYNGPWLEDSEVEWHADKLRNFNGSTLLLSHHQLFSQHSPIQSRFAQRPWMNEHLMSAFSPYFDRIACWFWGHEHNLALFRDGLMGLAKGRLVGSSAYEETTGETPYSPHNADYAEQVPYMEAMPLVSQTDGYYNHAFAVLDFKRAGKEDPIACTYYEFPSWGSRQPDTIQAKVLMQETIPYKVPAPPVPGAVIKSGDVVLLRNQTGGYVAGFKTGKWPTYFNFPTVSPTDKVKLKLSLLQGTEGGELKDEAEIRIETTEMQKDNCLGAWKDRHELYYYQKDYNKERQGWRLRKVDPTDSTLRDGDEVYIYNRYWTDGKMCQEGQWLTTKADIPDKWTIVKL
ncbi:metallophosphoesterase [Paenibacillus sp. FJAT-26967]|uniref:metallophosphoesterase family protein n=1 Tax=Paenibacillus sp. FJAT-26967 TaxID=1729690 RepID=UPI000A027CE5|nr:metallophosphoesterase [Paenibacillus sp. FJAT-26967]